MSTQRPMTFEELAKEIGMLKSELEKAKKDVEAFHDWIGDYRGPSPAELRLLIRGNDRGHSQSVDNVMKVADDFEAWIEEGKELIASPEV